MELKATKCHMNGKNKEEHFSVQLHYICTKVVVQVLPYIHTFPSESIGTASQIVLFLF